MAVEECVGYVIALIDSCPPFGARGNGATRTNVWENFFIMPLWVYKAIGNRVS